MEARKIGIACFVGACACYAVAALVAPAYSVLGIFAGLASGYLAYEYREVLRAMPAAWNKTCEQFSLRFEALQGFRREMQTAAFERRVYLYPGMVLATIFYLSFVAFSSITIVPEVASAGWFAFSVFVIVAVIMAFVFAVLCVFGANAILLFLAKIGARRWERCYFVWVLDAGSEIPCQEIQTEWEEIGLRRAELTYGNFFRWAVEGLASCLVTTALSPIWVPLRIVLALGWLGYKALVVGGFFVWEMFVLIHSHKRILCAVDGTIGGTTAFLWLYLPSLSMSEHMLIAGFGGCIGAALGIFNWEIVSVRILKVNAQSSVV